jgi:gas vesicle protein
MSLAAVAGFITGILTAPQSGKKTRSDIKENLTANMGLAEDKLTLLHSEINELINIAKEETKEDILNPRNIKRYKMILEMAQASKEKLSSILEEIKTDGHSSKDEDLKQAIKDAEKSIKHVKSFLLKK